MKPRETLAKAIAPDGSCFELQRHDGNYIILADGYVLMTSYSHGSEKVMMSLACPRPRAHACILIGGLGMGYTLAATLDLLQPGGSVVVSELVPEVVEWNRGQSGPLAGYPLDDPRTDLIVGDVADVIRDSKSRFDAVLLELGPQRRFVHAGRQLMALHAGGARCHKPLAAAPWRACHMVGRHGEEL